VIITAPIKLEMNETKRNTKERHRGTEPFRNAGTKYLRERRVCGVGESDAQVHSASGRQAGVDAALSSSP